MRWLYIIAASIAAGVLLDAAVLYTLYSSPETLLDRLENEALMDLNRYDPAGRERRLSLSRELWRARHDAYGPEDRRTLLAHDDFADRLFYSSRREEWGSEIREVIETVDRVFGAKDRDFMWVRIKMARNLEEMNRIVEAEDVYRGLMRDFDDRSGLESILERQEKYDEELELVRLDLKGIEPLAAEQRIRVPHGKHTDYQAEERRLQKDIQVLEAKARTKHDYEEAQTRLGSEHSEVRRLKEQLEELKRAGRTR